MGFVALTSYKHASCGCTPDARMCVCVFVCVVACLIPACVLLLHLIVRFVTAFDCALWSWFDGRFQHHTLTASVYALLQNL